MSIDYIQALCKTHLPQSINHLVELVDDPLGDFDYLAHNSLHYKSGYGVRPEGAEPNNRPTATRSQRQLYAIG